MVTEKKCKDTGFSKERKNSTAKKHLIVINPEVEFVHPVSAGGSVKFLPAVYILPETMRFAI